MNLILLSTISGNLWAAQSGMLLVVILALAALFRPMGQRVTP